MRDTQHFHRGLLLGMINEKKRISKKQNKIFLEFLVCCKQANKKGKAKMSKTIYTGKLPTSRRRTKKSFWVFFLVLQQFKLGRKIKKKQEICFWISSMFFKHTRRKQTGEGRTKTRKTIYMGMFPTSKKKNRKIFLGFLFNTTTKS